jgi:hypothetical protein
VAGPFAGLFVDGKLCVVADCIDVRPPSHRILFWWLRLTPSSRAPQVVGNKAIVEGRSEGETLKAGPYCNKCVHPPTRR